jgi:hypothetical protein
MAVTNARYREPVSKAELVEPSAALWDRALRHGRPTRSDDTVVIEGRRATLEEIKALIAKDKARRPGPPEP